jgi:signal transduction histidine kinase
MRRKDGTTFDADVGLSRITQSKNSASDIVCSVRDITDRIRAEAQIVRLNRDLERWAIELENALQKEKELSELKSRFVSMVSHEFRTPLATILSSSDLIKNFYARMTDDRRNEHLNTIQTSVQHLTEMLDEILMMSKAENVGLDFQPIFINLEAFCNGIAHQIQLGATAHEIVISTEGDCSQVVADEKLMRRIMNNLLTNAIKYSPQGGRIEIELRCDGHSAVICVKDEGIGIPDEDQQRLFETFHRARNVGTISGTGLGLAIVKQAIEAHGGTIHFASQVGVGTAFTVQWPVKTALTT